MRKKIDSYLIISNGEEEKDKGISCVARIGIDNYSINEKGSMLVMDAVKFIEERKRMCKSFGMSCKGCPAFGTDEEALCCAVEKESSLDATAQIAIVEEWSAAHPCKTRQDVFLEQYPETNLDKYGIIQICPTQLFSAYRSDKLGCTNSHMMCQDCRRWFWMQEAE